MQLTDNVLFDRLLGGPQWEGNTNAVGRLPVSLCRLPYGVYLA